MTPTDTQKVIGPFRQIITMRHLPLKGSLNDDQLEIIEDGGVVIQYGNVIGVDNYNQLLTDYPEADREVIEGEHVLFPGLIDCHTHLCFAGSRAMDFAARNNGKTYLEIAKEGGGIWSTVKATRAASKDELIIGLKSRMDTLIASGVTTVEIKSGYGLNADHELKMLRAIQEADQDHSIDTIATCLAAHIIPNDFNGTEDVYLDYIINSLLPTIKRDNLARRFDAFIEESAFHPKLAKAFLLKVKEEGFDITIHGDQFTPGGSEVAIEVGAKSVDHLEASTLKEIDDIANSNVTAVALPGASLGLGIALAPARELLNRGASLAIASDWNPGSAPQGNLLLQASILSTYEKLSAAEVWAGLTYRAANALNIHDRGIIDAQKMADLTAFPTGDFREVLYLQGSLTPSHTWKKGKLVHGSTDY